jgi:hypothetical protein
VRGRALVPCLHHLMQALMQARDKRERDGAMMREMEQERARWSDDAGGARWSDDGAMMREMDACIIAPSRALLSLACITSLQRETPRSLQPFHSPHAPALVPPYGRSLKTSGLSTGWRPSSRPNVAYKNTHRRTCVDSVIAQPLVNHVST